MKFVGIVGLVCGLGFGAAQAAEPASLLRSAPEAQGVSSSALAKFVTTADQTIPGMHGVVVVRHGQVILEGWWNPYDAATRHSLYSLSKSFTSTAVGLAIADGKLSLDDEVLKFFPDDAPDEPSKNLKSMRVSDLLRMSTGHQAEAKVADRKDQAWTKTFLAQPVPFKPGTHFLYNTPATYMLSAIVQKVTGQTVLDYLRPRLFDPLGIKDPTWDTSPQGISLGGYGLSIRTEDIARFGQLYLQHGKWDGKQLVPESWVEAATTRQTSNGSNPASDWDQGYGYQFWRSRHGAFRGDGAFGQFCVVIPEQDTVVAINSGTGNLQAVLDVVWDHLLPALQPSPLAADPTAEAALKAKLASLTLPIVEGSPSNEMASKVLGKRYSFAANPLKLESATLEAGPDGVGALLLRTDGQDQKIPLGTGTWIKGRAAFGPLSDQPAAACGAWTADDTFTARVAFVETPFQATMKFRFDGNEVTLDTSSNVGFGATRSPHPQGQGRMIRSLRPALLPALVEGPHCLVHFGSRTNATSSVFPSGSVSLPLVGWNPSAVTRT